MNQIPPTYIKALSSRYIVFGEDWIFLSADQAGTCEVERQKLLSVSFLGNQGFFQFFFFFWSYRREEKTRECCFHAPKAVIWCNWQVGSSMRRHSPPTLVGRESNSSTLAHHFHRVLTRTVAEQTCMNWTWGMNERVAGEAKAPSGGLHAKRNLKLISKKKHFAVVCRGGRLWKSGLYSRSHSAEESLIGPACLYNE